MGAGFIAAMRGAVLNGNKPMQDFVRILQEQDKRRSMTDHLTETGFRAEWITARRVVCQDAKCRAEQLTEGLDVRLVKSLLPALGGQLTWRAAGDHICALAKHHLRATPNLTPEDALRVTVKGIIKQDRQARGLLPV